MGIVKNKIIISFFAIIVCLGLLYVSIFLIKEIRPVIFGNKIRAKIHKIDSTYSKHLKQYNYYPVIEYKVGDKLLYKALDDLQSDKETYNNKSDLIIYYDDRYGFYNVDKLTVTLIFTSISLFFLFLSLLFFYQILYKNVIKRNN